MTNRLSRRALLRVVGTVAFAVVLAGTMPLLAAGGSMYGGTVVFAGNRLMPPGTLTLKLRYSDRKRIIWSERWKTGAGSPEIFAYDPSPMIATGTRYLLTAELNAPDGKRLAEGNTGFAATDDKGFTLVLNPVSH